MSTGERSARWITSKMCKTNEANDQKQTKSRWLNGSKCLRTYIEEKSTARVSSPNKPLSHLTNAHPIVGKRWGGNEFFEVFAAIVIRQNAREFKDVKQIVKLLHHSTHQEMVFLHWFPTNAEFDLHHTRKHWKSALPRQNEFDARDFQGPYTSLQLHHQRLQNKLLRELLPLYVPCMYALALHQSGLPWGKKRER